MTHAEYVKALIDYVGQEGARITHMHVSTNVQTAFRDGKPVATGKSFDTITIQMERVNK